MTASQNVVTEALQQSLDNLQGGDELRPILERIRSRVAEAGDTAAELRALYGVEGCDELALGLLWVHQQAEREPERSDPSDEDVRVTWEALHRTLARMGYTPPEQAAADVPEEPSPGEVDAEAAPETPVEPEQLSEVEESAEGQAPDAFDSGQPDAGEASPSPDVIGGSAGTALLGEHLEAFLEAVQSGSDDRAPALAALRADIAACRADEGAGDDLKRYAEVVDDFLGYIQDNQLLDDIRVMNFMTNIQEPYAQWLAAAEGEREGILDQAVQFLSDFRTMFE